MYEPERAGSLSETDVIGSIARTNDAVRSRKAMYKELSSQRGRKKGFKSGRIRALNYNPLGTKVARKNPGKQTKVLLVKDDLTAMLGRRRSTCEGWTELSLRSEGEDHLGLCISAGKLGLKSYATPGAAYRKNLSFFHGWKNSCAPLKYVAQKITEIGISRRMFMRMRHASHLDFIGKSARAFRIVRSLANEYHSLGRRRPNLYHGTESSTSASSPFGDWRVNLTDLHMQSYADY